MGKVFAVGVGPGSKNYVTETVRKTVQKADVVVGYKYTLEAISDLIKDNPELLKLLRTLMIIFNSLKLFKEINRIKISERVIK